VDRTERSELTLGTVVPSADSRRGVSYIGGPSSQASRPGSAPAATMASRPR
jgi:hypothetical protein